MSVLSRLASPLVRFLSLSTEGVIRLFRIKPSSGPAITPEEIKVLMDQGTRMGIFEEAEQDLVESIFRLGDRRASVLMTPRADITWLDVDHSLEMNWQRILDSGYSQFPVCQGGLENTLGIVSLKTLCLFLVKGENPDLRLHLIKPLFIHEGLTTLKVLDLFRETGNHIALVVDEYGSIQGMVTLHDVLEAIVGAMPSLGEESYAGRRPPGRRVLAPGRDAARR